MGKGAIRAGIEVRLQETGLKNLDGIFLAGALGNNVRVKSPKGIGLLPRIRDDRITTVGNAADTEAIMSLLSKKDLETAFELPERIEHIELSVHNGFQRFFGRSIGLG